ncbi:MULE domain-containing protein [Trichonephila clavipes]|nr:MULE domain-containing protein [Trichonephila clavipes]
MSKYVRQRGCKTLQNGEIVMNYHCCRSGTYKPKGKGLKNLKSHGSAKIGISCPAVIKVRQSTENVVVHYFPKHQNHETQLEHLRLSESDRTAIAVALSLSSLLNYLRAFGDGPVAGAPGGQGIESWLACLEFEPSATKDRRVGQRCTLNLSRAEMSSRWCGKFERIKLAQLQKQLELANIQKNLPQNSDIRNPSVFETAANINVETVKVRENFNNTHTFKSGVI